MRVSLFDRRRPESRVGPKPTQRWWLRGVLAGALMLILALAFAVVPPLGFRNVTCAGPHPPDCRVANGRVVYIQRTDPDGGGDLHVVLLSRQSVSFPTLSIVKFKRETRPHRKVGLGDWVSARGYVMRGSHQKEALVAISYRIAY